MASEQDPPAENGPPDHEGSGGGETPPEPPLGDEPSPSGGSIRFQDPATTQRRPLTVGEDRALDKVIRKTQERGQARFAAEEARFAAEAKRRRLIGGAAVVGVVGLVAAMALHSSHNVTAQCVRDDSDGQQVIAPDSYCTGHTAGYNGFFFYSGHSYRYYYGSAGSIGSPPVGGTTVAPRGATITTGSGTTIQRGGLGSRFSGGGSGS